MKIRQVKGEPPTPRIDLQKPDLKIKVVCRGTSRFT